MPNTTFRGASHPRRARAGGRRGSSRGAAVPAAGRERLLVRRELDAEARASVRFFDGGTADRRSTEGRRAASTSPTGRRSGRSDGHAHVLRAPCAVDAAGAKTLRRRAIVRACRTMRVAVVTGGSSGIGAAIARRARGDAAGTRPARRAARGAAAALAEEIGGEYEVCDVADREAVERVAARVLERHPQIDLLVNNAGIPGRGDFLDADAGADRAASIARRTTSARSGACARSCPRSRRRAVARRQHRLGRGHGRLGRPGPYSASKHAQLAFSRAVAARARAARDPRAHGQPGLRRDGGLPAARAACERAAAAARRRPGRRRRAVVRASSGTAARSSCRAGTACRVAQALAPGTLARLMGSSAYRAKTSRAARAAPAAAAAASCRRGSARAAPPRARRARPRTRHGRGARCRPTR